MDKKFTAEEAAKAVLKKAEQMLKSSKLANAGAASLPKSEDDSTMAMSQENAVQKETINQHDPAQQKENGNPPWGTEPGHYKLARFMGHRDARKKDKNTQAPAPAAAPVKEQK